MPSLAHGDITQVTNLHAATSSSVFHGRLGESCHRQKPPRCFRFFRGLKRCGRLRLEPRVSALRIKRFHRSDYHGQLTQAASRLHDAMPCHGRNRLRERAGSPGDFALKCARVQQRHYITVKIAAQSQVENDDGKANQSTGSSARTRVSRADLGSDQMQ